MCVCAHTYTYTYISKERFPLIRHRALLFFATFFGRASDSEVLGHHSPKQMAQTLNFSTIVTRNKRLELLIRLPS